MIDAGTGNDRIDSLDGAHETVRCGAGRDRVLADRGDRLIGCEVRVRSLEKLFGQAIAK